MRVGVYQNDPAFGQVAANIEQAVADLSPVDADLVVLPELFATGYQFLSRKEVSDLAEEIPHGKTCRAMAALARKNQMGLVFGIAEQEKGRLYNSAAVVGPQGFMGRYRKTHLFAQEKTFFDPGDTGFRVFDMGDSRIGVMICFDWIFPESARILALLGADMICHPANLVLPHCQRAMRTRSLENGLFTLTANRIGTEERGETGRLTYTGESQIVDTRGDIVTRMGKLDTGVQLTDIDPLAARDKAITPQNDRLKDRRPTCYQILAAESG